jgi:hypothetical protein
VVFLLKDPNPLEVYGTEFFVDGSQLGFLGKTHSISFMKLLFIYLFKTFATKTSWQETSNRTHGPLQGSTPTPLICCLLLCVIYICFFSFSVSDNDMNLVVYRYKPEGKLRAWNVLVCLAFRDQQMVPTAQLQGTLVPALENIVYIHACILKAHSHSKSGGSIWASLECQCCFWIAEGLVSYLTTWLLTLQLFKNSTDSQGQEAQIEPPLFKCECEWAFRIQSQGFH